jgi:hypothetical protein
MLDSDYDEEEVTMSGLLRGITMVIGVEAEVRFLPELVRTVGEYILETDLGKLLRWWEEWCLACTTTCHERYSDTQCSTCEKPLWRCERWWSAHTVGLDIFLCERCFHDETLAVPITYFQCDAKQVFPPGTTDTVLECASFDLRRGWRREVSQDLNLDLCEHHLAPLLASSSPEHEKWKQTFVRKISVKDMMCMHANERIYWGRQRPIWRRYPEMLVSFDPEHSKSNLKIPIKLVHESAWIKAAKMWFKFNEKTGCSEGAQWDDLSTVNGSPVRYLTATILENILDWLPFDVKNGGQCFALANCNKESKMYQRVVIATVNDDAPRTATKDTVVTLLDIDLATYLQQPTSLIDTFRLHGISDLPLLFSSPD